MRKTTSKRAARGQVLLITAGESQFFDSLDPIKARACRLHVFCSDLRRSGGTRCCESVTPACML